MRSGYFLRKLPKLLNWPSLASENAYKVMQSVPLSFSHVFSVTYKSIESRGSPLSIFVFRHIETFSKSFNLRFTEEELYDQKSNLYTNF